MQAFKRKKITPLEGATALVNLAVEIATLAVDDLGTSPTKAEIVLFEEFGNTLLEHVTIIDNFTQSLRDENNQE